MLLFSGCQSKIVNIQDPDGEPVPDALIAAYQGNIFWVNESRMFKTDKNGQAIIPFSEFVSLYIGKKGYCLNYSGVAKSNVIITLIPYDRGTSEPRHISHLISEKYRIPPQYLWQEWVEYIRWLERKRAGSDL
jgi:hypothetical protein